MWSTFEYFSTVLALHEVIIIIIIGSNQEKDKRLFFGRQLYIWSIVINQ